MCGLVNDPGIYKPSRPSQISKSEHLVQCHADFDRRISIRLVLMLRKTSSRIPLNYDATNFLSSLNDVGKQKHQEFLEYRLRKGDVAFHDAIKRERILNFNSAMKKTVTKSKQC